MDRVDQVKVLLKKSRTEIEMVIASLRAGALDAAAPRAYRAAGKLLTAYLVYQEQEEPKTEDLEQLLAMCVALDPSFSALDKKIQPLQKYLEESRAEKDYFPLRHLVIACSDATLDIRDFLQGKLPKELAKFAEETR
jgi:HEPN domain-containing protein